MSVLKARVGGAWDRVPVIGAAGKAGVGIPPYGRPGALLAKDPSQESGVNWQHMPYGRLSKNSAQSITAATWTPIGWNVDVYDTGGINNVAVTTRQYAPIDGIYEINCVVITGYVASQRHVMRVMLEDAVYAERGSAVAISNCATGISCDMAMSAGQDVYISLYCQATASLVVTQPFYNYVELRWTGPL